MLDPEHFVVVTGRQVVTVLYQQRRAAVLRDAHLFEHPDGALVAQQVRDDNAGYLGAELVKSINGWTLRHASGLHGFSIIERCGRDWDNAVRVANRWAAQEPARRYVFVRKSERSAS